MSKVGMWVLSAIAALCVLSFAGSAVAAVPAAKVPAYSSYVMSSGPQVALGRGVRVDQTGGQTADSGMRFDPLILKLAREGQVQNIRPSGDGTLSLLASPSAVEQLRSGGSSLSAMAALSPAAAQPLSGTIAGTVTAQGGGAIAGATVSAFSGGTVVTGTTQADGTYSLGIDVDGDYQVGVFATGYEWQPGVLVAVPSAANNVNFALVPQNLTISGTITTQQGGSPIAGVQVYATDLVYDNFTAGDFATTDANGNYTLQVSAATYEVRAFLPPRGTKSLTVVVPPSATGKNFRFNLNSTVHTISGILRKSDGSPLPGAQIAFYSLDVPFSSCDAWYTNMATAGSDGSYSLTLPAGLYQMYANWPQEWADHWVIATENEVNISGSLTNFNVTLPAVGTIRGVVRDPGGQPLANATVFSWRNSPTNTWFDGFFTTDATGSYVVTATLGSHSLLAFSSNYINSSVQTVNLTGNTTGIDFQVAAGISAGGTLNGSDARPLAWADVTYQSGPSGARFNRHGIVYYNGTWRAVLPAGSHTFAVSQSYYTEQTRTVNIAPSPPPIDFTLARKSVRLNGRITNTAGGGLCDAYMTAANTGTGLSAYGNSTGDGNYSMMVAPGTYNVFPYKYRSNSPQFNTQVTVPPAPSTIDFRITEIFFQDVFTDSFFFEPVGFLIYSGIASGYADGTYRPYENTTRGQLSKMVVLGEAWELQNPTTPTFSDVPTTNPFYTYIETAYSQGVISGYADGTFRWGSNITRGQLSKIIVLAEGWPLVNPPTPHFSDVPASNPFYQHIETAFSRNIISGYNDGTFRPGNNATRGQIAKIVYNALTAP